jgi:excisionase family DNA binding protein
MEGKTRSPKLLYTIAEVAYALNLSKRSVESLIAQGILRSGIAPGTDRARRISQSMIDEYLDTFNSQNPPVNRLYRRR